MTNVCEFKITSSDFDTVFLVLIGRTHKNRGNTKLAYQARFTETKLDFRLWFKLGKRVTKLGLDTRFGNWI